MGKFADHDAYIDAAAEEMRPMLRNIRRQLAVCLPDTEEIIAYDMPGFGFGKTIIVGYAAFTRQCGIYVDNRAISACADDIASSGLKASKTGVTFPPAKPISDALIVRLALEARKALGV